MKLLNDAIEKGFRHPQMVAEYGIVGVDRWISEDGLSLRPRLKRQPSLRQRLFDE